MLIYCWEDRRFVLGFEAKTQDLSPVIILDSMPVDFFDHCITSFAVTFLICIMLHWQIFFHNALNPSIWDSEFIFCAASCHTLIWYGNFVNFGHIFIAPWSCWPAMVPLVFWWFMVVFVSAVPVTCSGFLVAWSPWIMLKLNKMFCCWFP